MAGQPNAPTLVEVDWLRERLDDRNLRIVDCDPPDAYKRAHIAGAIGVEDNWFKDPNDRRYVMKPEQFAATMSALGIGDETDVLAYDGAGNHYAARLWWCLAYYGHSRVWLLNGGWQQWFGNGLPVSIERTSPPPGRFTPRANESLRASAEDVLRAISRDDAVILDVRSDDEWLGKNDRGNKRAGHIPGAVHVEWLNNVTADELQRVKNSEELRAMYEAAGVTPDKEIVVHCQAGIRAAQSTMTLKVLGYERVRNYDGSFLEWANRDDTPLVVE